MNLEELTALKKRLRIKLEWNSDIGRELIKEAARAKVDIKYFEKEYEKAKEALRGLDGSEYKTGNREELSKDLLTITIVNTYESLRNCSKKNK